MTSPAIPILSSIADLAVGSDAWIVDIWGVMHNGARAFEAAGAACRRFRARGGIVVLLSNAPRPFSAVIGQMSGLGVDPGAYDDGRDLGRCDARHDRGRGPASRCCISARSATSGCSMGSTCGW